MVVVKAENAVTFKMYLEKNGLYFITEWHVAYGTDGVPAAPVQRAQR
jgi:hypothetical protein